VGGSTGTVETWTTPYEREGLPEKVSAGGAQTRGGRTLAVLTDRSEAQASVDEDIAGAKVTVRADGTASLG
jgi:acetyl-CoA C-acetyltransferase